MYARDAHTRRGAKGELVTRTTTTTHVAACGEGRTREPHHILV